MEEIDLKDFLSYLKKYILLFIFLIILSVSLVVVYDKRIKKPMYTTYTTVVLAKANTTSLATNNESINQSDVILNQNLVSTYRQIINSRLVLEQTIDSLNLNYTVKELAENVEVVALEDTEIIKISVSDGKPDNAAKIANKIAEIFIKEITKIYKMNNVSVVDKAQVSYEVSNNTLKKDCIIAAILSILIPTVILFIKYYFDDTVKLNETLEKEIGMPILAPIFNEKSGEPLIVEKKPKSVASECIRTLRTNLQFSSVDEEIKTILVTSTLPSEGKSFVSSNLAIAFAQSGKNVLLIDCDLRKGRQHKIFNLKNDQGFSNLLIGDFGDKFVKHTKINKLSIITRGICPPNPSELLNSKKNNKFMKEIGKIYDIVIFDSAPCNGLADSLILSSQVDKVVLVSSENYTPKNELINTKKAIEKVGGNIAGVVINNVKEKGNSNKYYYYYGD